MVRPIEVRPVGRYRIWLRYQDGTEGEVDPSDLAGRGVFAAWNSEGVFDAVQLGPHGAVEWPGDLDLCPDALYLRLTGKRSEEVFSGPEGAVIKIFYDDHNPPHFHVEYASTRCWSTSIRSRS
jgi:hypothetical protein